MKITKKTAQALQQFLYENYGEMDTSVGIGAESLMVYVQRGKSFMKEVPAEWMGIPVEVRWSGKVKPL